MLRAGPGLASRGDRGATRKLLYTIAAYTETGIQKPDYLATVDVDPDRPTYSQPTEIVDPPRRLAAWRLRIWSFSKPSCRMGSKLPSVTAPVPQFLRLWPTGGPVEQFCGVNHGDRRSVTDLHHAANIACGDNVGGQGL